MKLMKGLSRKVAVCVIVSLLAGSCVGIGALANTVVLPTEKEEESSDDASEVVMYNDHSYEICDKAMSWDDAKASCESRGGHLVCINDAEEQKFIQTIVVNGNMSYYWIGLSDAESEGVFKWVNGDPLTYTNWNVDQPDNWNDQEDSVMLSNRDAQYVDWFQAFGTWNDMNSNGDRDHSLNEMGFICEWDYIDKDRRQALESALNELEKGLTQEGIAVDIDKKNGTVTIDSAILFDVGSYAVKEEGQEVIGKLVSALGTVLANERIRDRIASINIQGHTDSDGTYEKNVELSENRAAAVRDVCLDYVGSDPTAAVMFRSLLKTSGCASDYPVLDENGVEDKAASRRVVFVFHMK